MATRPASRRATASVPDGHGTTDAGAKLFPQYILALRRAAVPEGFSLVVIGLLHHLAENSVLVLFLLIGLDMLVGHAKVKGVSLGAAAVLFAGIALAAAGVSKGVIVEVPAPLGSRSAYKTTKFSTTA